MLSLLDAIARYYFRRFRLPFACFHFAAAIVADDAATLLMPCRHMLFHAHDTTMFIAAFAITRYCSMIRAMPSLICHASAAIDAIRLEPASCVSPC